MLRVSHPHDERPQLSIADNVLDANLFKEAFIKAQQENEKIFGASE